MGFGKMHALAALGLVVAGASVTRAATFNGNGATGFGGTVGNGTLAITESAGNLTFTVTPSGPNADGNKVVLYLDTRAGGLSSTATLTDEGDYGRKLVSGGTANNPDAGNAPSRSTVNFAAGFGADYGISFNPGDYGPGYDITVASGDNGPGTYSYVGGNSLAGGAGPYSVTIARSAVGLGPTDGFQIVGTLISGTLYRSNETFGTSTATPNDGSGNPGFNGSVTFTNSLTYAVPEPATLGTFAAVGIALLRRRRGV